MQTEVTTTEMKEFYDYVMNFYGAKSELYPEMNFTTVEVAFATSLYIRKYPEQFCGDSFDRELVRDLVLDLRTKDSVML